MRESVKHLVQTTSLFERAVCDDLYLTQAVLKGETSAVVGSVERGSYLVATARTALPSAR